MIRLTSKVQDMGERISGDEDKIEEMNGSIKENDRAKNIHEI